MVLPGDLAARPVTNHASGPLRVCCALSVYCRKARTPATVTQFMVPLVQRTSDFLPSRVLSSGILAIAAFAWMATSSAAEERQFRGNLHTHSLWSDGDDYPEMIAKWYRDQGYNFLCFTDHNTLQIRDRWSDVEKNAGGRAAWEKLKAAFPDSVDERTKDGRLEVRLSRFDETRALLERPGEFLLVHGEEISDRFRNLPLHLNASNLKEFIPPLGGESVVEVLQNNINALNSQRERTGQPMIIHVNHPNFGYAITERDLMRLSGEKFFEVYNGHPSVRNRGDDSHPGTERIWDVVLAMRLGVLRLPVMYGLAVDDGHNYHGKPATRAEPGRGWIMVFAKELTAASLFDAMEAGRFYASSGVTLADVSATPDQLSVTVTPEEGVTYTVDFIGTLKADLPPRDAIEKTDRDWNAGIGRVLGTKTLSSGTATWKLQGNEIYVRARVTSSRKHPSPAEPGEFQRAWVQPIVGPAALRPDEE